MFLALNKSLRTLLLITVVFTATFLMPQPTSATAVCVCYFGDVNDCEPTAVSDAAMDGECKKACEDVRGSGLKSYKYAATATDGGAIIAECSAAHATATKEEPVNAVYPKLSVDIPGVTFSPIKKIGGELHVNFLQDYIGGVYTYLLTFSTLAAIVLVVVAGLQYVIGAVSQPQIASAKKRILNAVTGLVLLLSVAMILETVNPQLTSLITPLRVKFVPKIDWEAQVMSESETTVVASNYTSTEPPIIAKNCPIELLSPAYGPIKSIAAQMLGIEEGSYKDLRTRQKEFVTKAKPLINAATPGERIKQAAELVSACAIYYGSCGEDSSMLYALAGVGPYDCLFAERGKTCNDNYSNSKYVYSVYTVLSNEIRWKLPSYYCLRQCSCKTFGKSPWNLQDYCDKKNSQPGCTTDRAEAVARVTVAVKNNPKYSPDALNLLQPGDYFSTYNANDDCVGLHSTVFLGWKKPGKEAYVIDGDVKHLVRIRTRDLSKSLLTSIKRPGQKPK